ncbi:MAG: aspartate 1-decarboxylase [bacterium]
MLITVCKSKIHRATVKFANLDYVGSITIDSNLMKAADLIPYEKVQVANISNGERFETYVIEGEAGSGSIGLNGAAAHKGSVGDLVIIIAYGLMDKKEAANFKPAIVHVDSDNKAVS